MKKAFFESAVRLCLVEVILTFADAF